METRPLGVSPLKSSRLAYGCWRLGGSWDPAQVTRSNRAEGIQAVRAAYEAGYTLFDNADIYCRGEAERILGAALKEIPGMRDRVLIMTKGGIRPAGDPDPDSPARYDFSADHLLHACEKSLERLGIETIDLYLLHRPDLLADPEEIARAFSKLKESGKVRWFGVSNFRPTLLTALQVACPMPLIVHQIEISLAQLDPFTDGTLDQCLIENITPMAWSPLAGGLIGEGATRLLPFQQAYRPEKILPVLDAIARQRGTTRSVVALAWLLLHPSNILPVIGSINPARIRAAAESCRVALSRKEWYQLLLAARADPLP